MRVSYVAEVTFDFPEARYLRAVVKPKCDADLPFSIDNARWELYYRDDDGEEILEDSGECEVSAHELSAFKYIYEIAGETWVDNVKIKAG